MSKTILLIDDDVEDRELFRMILQTLDSPITLIEATDGIHAFELISGDNFQAPDIIFYDLNMPRMNGIEFLLQLRAKNLFSNVPLIMLSTSVKDFNTDRCLEAGAKECLEKPSSLNAFAEVVRNALSRNLNMKFI